MLMMRLEVEVGGGGGKEEEEEEEEEEELTEVCVSGPFSSSIGAKKSNPS